MIDEINVSSAGRVQEKREIKTKAGDVFRRIVKMLHAGMVTDWSCEPIHFNAMEKGQEYEVVGRIEPGYEGRLDFVLTNMKPQKQ